jgi:hypothetical protein
MWLLSSTATVVVSEQTNCQDTFGDIDAIGGNMVELDCAGFAILLSSASQQPILQRRDQILLLRPMLDIKN